MARLMGAVYWQLHPVMVSVAVVMAVTVMMSVAVVMPMVVGPSAVKMAAMVMAMVVTVVMVVPVMIARDVIHNLYASTVRKLAMVFCGQSSVCDRR